MKEQLESEEFYYAIIVPSYAIAPDGTLLFPTKMKCGCQIVEFLNKDSLPKKDNIIVSVKSCINHAVLVNQSRLELTIKESYENYFWTPQRAYPIVKGVAREKILHGEDFAES